MFRTKNRTEQASAAAAEQAEVAVAEATTKAAEATTTAADAKSAEAAAAGARVEAVEARAEATQAVADADAAQAKAEKAAAERAHAASDNAAADLKGRAHDLAGRAAPKVDAAREAAKDVGVAARDRASEAPAKLHEAAEAFTPHVEKARETFMEDVLPKITAAMVTAAAGATAAKKAAVDTADRAPEALSVLKGEAVATKKGSGGGHHVGTWLVLLGLAGAGAAAYSYFKTREKADPWATAGPYSPPSSGRGSVGDKVGELASTAKAKAAAATGAVKEKAGEVSGAAASTAGAAGTDRPSEGAPDPDLLDAGGSATDLAEDLEVAGEGMPTGVGGEDSAFGEGALDQPVETWGGETGLGEEGAHAETATSEGADLGTPHVDEGR
ncbi:MAG TPA: hypothetical protein VES95_13015 [Dermatophilaceae bacterium]|nr:hypothetical protein [Dermatophilaceae bacterium]